jgi:hypothetical protein
MARPIGRPRTFTQRHRFLVSLDDAEYRRLQAVCRRTGLSASAFARMVTLVALDTIEAETEHTRIRRRTSR